MSATYADLAHLVRFNDRNVEDLGLTDLLQDAPLLQVLHSKPATQSTLHKYLKETRASSAAFRAVNTGLSKTKSQDTLVTETLEIIDASYTVDMALADAYNGGRDAYLQVELARSMRNVFHTLEKQVINGKQTVEGGASGGFTGLADEHTDLGAKTISAGGSEAAKQTSCYLIRHDDRNVAFVLGAEGNFTVQEEPQIIQAYSDDDANLGYPALYVPVLGYGGLQRGGLHSHVRIANICTNVLTSTDAFTDDTIYGALSAFPSGRQPNAIVMNRDALRLLRQSRSATNATGAPAPRPTEVEGIPIIVTDAISSVENVITS
jgi:hypothetical protein